MNKQKLKRLQHHRRHLRVRKKTFGTADRPRLAVYRSLKHIYAQIIDDISGQTLTAASSQSADVREAVQGTGNCAAAQAVGKRLAQKAVAHGIRTVVFDRGGFRYHGRIKALADAAREGGLVF
jgi:large subunit ribosomal protein L18